MANKFCDDCVYYVKLGCGSLRCCNCLIDTNHKRPCPPGAGCTVKISRKVYRRKRKGPINADN